MSKQTDLINVTDAITVDGSNNVGIGTSSPSSYASTTLEIKGSSTTSDIKMTNTTTGVGDAAGYDLELNGNDINYVNRTAGGNQKFWTNSTERMRIDAAGRVTTPYQPAFNVKWATSSSTAPVGIDTVAFSQVITNVGSHYNSSTGRFTAPVSGFYQFNLSMYFQNGTNYVGSMLQKSDGVVYYSFSSIGSDVMFYTSQAVYLNQNDYVFTRTYCGGSTTALRQYSHFSGYLIG